MAVQKCERRRRGYRRAAYTRSNEAFALLVADDAHLFEFGERNPRIACNSRRALLQPKSSSPHTVGRIIVDENYFAQEVWRRAFKDGDECAEERRTSLVVIAENCSIFFAKNRLRKKAIAAK